MLIDQKQYLLRILEENKELPKMYFDPIRNIFEKKIVNIDEMIGNIIVKNLTLGTKNETSLIT